MVPRTELIATNDTERIMRCTISFPIKPLVQCEVFHNCSSSLSKYAALRTDCQLKLYEKIMTSTITFPGNPLANKKFKKFVALRTKMPAIDIGIKQ